MFWLKGGAWAAGNGGVTATYRKDSFKDAND